ncbi:hypothetical protein ILYODFUR_035704, partial [Ilyodon furcidens]
GCDPILDESAGHSFRDRNKLTIFKVESENSGTYTCTLMFTLDGIARSVSETIEATVKDRYSLVPQVHEPENEIIKGEKGETLFYHLFQKYMFICLKYLY